MREFDRLKPRKIGEGDYGDIYSMPKNDIRGAVKFLADMRGGGIQDFYNYNGLGNIDLIWNDTEGGLCHIIDKHVGYAGDIIKDFATVDDLITSMEGVFKNGSIIEEDGNVCVIADDRYKIVLCKNLNKKGKNWILTSYDYTRSEKEKGLAGDEKKNGNKDVANPPVSPHDDNP